MAERTEGSIDIEATPTQIMEVIADFPAYPEWAQGVKDAEVLRSDAHGRGIEVSFHVSSMGVDARYTLAYRYAPRNGGLSWTTKEASGAVRDIEGEYVLEPTGARTRVIYRLAMDPAISLPGFLRRQAERQIVNTALGGLKRRVEGE
jgi:carbon monoxide dehydrogenase subunit G